MLLCEGGTSVEHARRFSFFFSSSSFSWPLRQVVEGVNFSYCAYDCQVYCERYEASQKVFVGPGSAGDNHPSVPFALYSGEGPVFAEADTVSCCSYLVLSFTGTSFPEILYGLEFIVK